MNIYFKSDVQFFSTVLLWMLHIFFFIMYYFGTDYYTLAIPKLTAFENVNWTSLHSYNIVGLPDFSYQTISIAVSSLSNIPILIYIFAAVFIVTDYTGIRDYDDDIIITNNIKGINRPNHDAEHFITQPNLLTDGILATTKCEYIFGPVCILSYILEVLCSVLGSFYADSGWYTVTAWCFAAFFLIISYVALALRCLSQPIYLSLFDKVCLQYIMFLWAFQTVCYALVGIHTIVIVYDSVVMLYVFYSVFFFLYVPVAVYKLKSASIVIGGHTAVIMNLAAGMEHWENASIQIFYATLTAFICIVVIITTLITVPFNEIYMYMYQKIRRNFIRTAKLEDYLPEL